MKFSVMIIDYSLSLEGVSIAGQPVHMTISVKTPGQTTVGAATNLQDIVIFSRGSDLTTTNVCQCVSQQFVNRL